MESNLVNIRFEPDETDTVTVDELLDFRSDLPCSSAETSKECYSIAVLTLQHHLLNERKQTSMMRNWMMMIQNTVAFFTQRGANALILITEHQLLPSGLVVNFLNVITGFTNHVLV